MEAIKLVANLEYDLAWKVLRNYLTSAIYGLKCNFVVESWNIKKTYGKLS